MRYINSSDIIKIGIDWHKTIDAVNEVVNELKNNNYVQPIKPYLRYGNPKNRIIAMPAYVGGIFEAAGIKWISSFPDNIKKNKKRANAIVVLNDVNDGKPYCIINAGEISAIRTASVSGYMIDQYFQNHDDKERKFNIGIIGFGPIGQAHLDMCLKFIGNKVEKIYLFDLKGILSKDLSKNSVILNNWQTLLELSDIVITCTVSENRYIDLPAKTGTLHLNVSLRDYCMDFMRMVDIIIVDDWNEVCRENTDIELMSKEHGLKKEMVFDLSNFQPQLLDLKNKVIMFNPMGMAIFDIAISQYYYKQSVELGVGTELF